VKTQRHAVGALIGTLAGYVILTVLMTWPVCAQLSSHLIGNGDDMWVHYWNGWWVKQVLRQGGNVFYTPLLFHPTGVSLLYHNFAWVNIAAWLAVEPLIGGIAAYNLAHVIHIPLCGLAMFLLARRLTHSDSAAFISGLVYAFWPYRMLDVNHPNMIATEAFPLLMLGLIKLVRDDAPVVLGILTGVVLALIGYTRWQLLILATVLIGLYALYVVVWDQTHWTWHRAGGLALAGLVALSLMAPGLYPLARDQFAGGLSEGLFDISADDPEQDLLAWIVPQHQHPLGQQVTRAFPGYGQSTARGRYAAYVGCVVVGLAAVGAASGRKRRRTWLWVGMAIFCFLMALGPILQVNGAVYDRVPMPYRLIGWLPPIRMLRHPHRFTALLALPLAALVGHGFAALRRLLSRHKWTRPGSQAQILTIVVGILILLDYWSFPAATVSASVPDFYAALANEPGSSAVVGLPGERQATERYMFFQTAHQHPILGGHVSRLPPDALSFASSVPLLRGIYRDGGLNTDASNLSHQLSLLADAGFRYIVIHKDLEKPETVTAWQRYFAIDPLYEDGEVSAYSTRPVAGRDYAVEYALGHGLGLVAAAVQRCESGTGPALILEAVWTAAEPPPSGVRAQVSLRGEDGPKQAQRFQISPDWPAEAWAPEALVRSRYHLGIAPDLPHGLYAVDLGVCEAHSGEIVGEQATIGHAVVGQSMEGRAVYPLDQALGIRFGEGLRLLGYSLKAEESRVSVRLHWLAERQLEQDYKFFVHLARANQKEPVAQADVMPHEWTYPTTAWQRGEVVSDEIVLSTTDVPPGNYEVLVGAYDPQTSARLSIRDLGPDLRLRDGSLVLPASIRR